MLSRETVVPHGKPFAPGSLPLPQRPKRRAPLPRSVETPLPAREEPSSSGSSLSQTIFTSSSEEADPASKGSPSESTHLPPSPFAKEKSMQTPPDPATLSATLKLPPLTQPPKLRFDSVPIPWHGLTLAAAQVTLSSTELQEMVARAIRLSAQESFIRLIPIDILDGPLAMETQRLQSRKAAAQAKFMFQVERRTAAIQALSALQTYGDGPENDDTHLTLGAIASQLSQTMAACDYTTEELLRIADQQIQIAKAQDVHTASSLAIALRKLNRGYGRKSMELWKAQKRINELEAQLHANAKPEKAVDAQLDAIILPGKESESEAHPDANARRAKEVEAQPDPYGMPARVVETTTATFAAPTDTDSTTDSEEYALAAQEYTEVATAGRSKTTGLNSRRSSHVRVRKSGQSIRSERSRRSGHISASSRRRSRASLAALRLSRRGSTKRSPLPSPSVSRPKHGTIPAPAPAPLGRLPPIPSKSLGVLAEQHNLQQTSFLDLGANDGSLMKSVTHRKSHSFSRHVRRHSTSPQRLFADTIPRADAHEAKRYNGRIPATAQPKRTPVSTTLERTGIELGRLKTRFMRYSNAFRRASALPPARV